MYVLYNVNNVMSITISIVSNPQIDFDKMFTKYVYWGNLITREIVLETNNYFDLKTIQIQFKT